jgi:hypothetical protein
MKKPEVQEGAPDSDAQEPRKLNMEEKRKLEKLLLSDIDSAVARHDAQAQDMRGNLIDKLTKNPPAEVKKLFDSHSLARKQVKQLESKLDALGFDIAYDGALRVNTHRTNAPLPAASPAGTRASLSRPGWAPRLPPRIGGQNPACRKMPLRLLSEGGSSSLRSLTNATAI